MGRKPRSDAFYHSLNEEQVRDLCDWLLEGMSYAAAKQQVESEFGVETSTGALHDFYHSYCAPELLRRRAEAVSTAEEVSKAAQQSPGQWDEAAREQLKQRVFELMLKPGSEAKDIKSLFGLVLKSKAQELDERRVKLLEEKAAKADNAKAALEERKAAGGLTDESLELIERTLGML